MQGCMSSKRQKRLCQVVGSPHCAGGMFTLRSAAQQPDELAFCPPRLRPSGNVSWTESKRPAINRFARSTPTGTEKARPSKTSTAIAWCCRTRPGDSASIYRTTHSEPWEATEVAAGRDPLAPRFDRQGGKIGVGDQISAGVGITTEPGKDLPVTSTGRQQHHVRPRPQDLGKLERFRKRCRRIEDPRVRRDPKKPAQHQIAETEGRFAGEGPLQPPARPVVAWSIFTKSPYQHVDIRQNHRQLP